MPSDLAVCYVGDVNFLLGSLISLRSLRRYASAADAEVYVFCLDANAALIDRLAPVGARLGASFLPLNLADQQDMTSKVWNETHVPPSALGRFFIEPLLPAHINRILYLDGDTLFVDDPKKLLAYRPPEGRLAAAEDISYFARYDWGGFGDRTRTYFRGLGIDADDGYLNSGVLFSGRETWKVVVAEALAYFNASSQTCVYHDQSAINAVIGKRRLRMSPRWNFQTPFRYWGVEGKIKPCLYHFTEHPKPWMGNVEPWLDVEPEMRDSLAAFADLDLPEHRLPPEKVSTLNHQKRERARRLGYMPLRLCQRRREIRGLAEGAVV